MKFKNHIAYVEKVLLAEIMEEFTLFDDNEEISKIYRDDRSELSMEHPELDRMISELEPETLIHLEHLHHLADDTLDLQRKLTTILEKGAGVQAHKENILIKSVDDPIFQNFLVVIEAIKQMDIKRRRVGMARARKRGVHPGPIPKLRHDSVDYVKMALSNGRSKTYIAHRLGVSRATLYKFLGKHNLS